MPARLPDTNVLTRDGTGDEAEMGVLVKVADCEFEGAWGIGGEWVVVRGGEVR